MVAFANGYGVSAVDGMVAAGYVTHERLQNWMRQSLRGTSIQDTTNSGLVSELEHRLEASDPADTISPFSELPAPDYEVRPRIWGNPADELHITARFVHAWQRL